MRPPKRFLAVAVLSQLPAWLTTELALHHLLWQSIASGAFIYFGALDSAVGWAAATVTLLSWTGLIQLLLQAHKNGVIMQAALCEGLEDRGLRAGSSHKTRQEHGGVSLARILLPLFWSYRHIERIADLPYQDDGDPRHKLDIFRRRDLTMPAPVLLQIHGGGWVTGSKRQQGQPLLHQLADAGWLCVAINYRLSPKATWPEHLIDCKRALAWIREHIASYGGDPELVVVTGGSAGGHLCAMMALTANDPSLQPGFEEADTRVQAFVPFFGVFDWTDRFGVRGSGDQLRKLLERVVVKEGRDDNPSVFDRASPMSHLSGEIPPAMILHGDKDLLAPVAEARKFVEMLRAASTEPVIYAELRGAHHSFELFPSVRTQHALNGVETFTAWVARQAQKEHRLSPPSDPSCEAPVPPSQPCASSGS